MKKYLYLKFVTFTFIASIHCLAFDEVKDLGDIQRINYDRCTAYNLDSNEVRVNEVIKSKPDALADYTNSIDTFLTNKKNVNPKRHATEDEQRDILQPLMATALIYGVTTTYANHGLSEGDALYWHFEILRAVEHLSFKYVESIKDYKNNTCRDYLAERQLEYGLLMRYGGITSDMFDMWFCEELAKHGGGFFNLANQSPLLPMVKEFNVTLYIQNNGEIISNTVASGLKCDLRTKKDTSFEHKLVPRKRYERVAEEIKRQITTIRRARGELPILKKQSSYSEIEDHAKPKTARKFKCFDDDSEIQVTVHDGYEIFEDEIMETYMWTKEDLKNGYKHSALCPGSIYKFRCRTPGKASSGKTAGTKFEYNTAVIISYLKTKRRNTVAKAEYELKRFYEELELECENLSIDDRMFIVDTEANGNSFTNVYWQN